MSPFPFCAVRAHLSDEQWPALSCDSQAMWCKARLFNPLVRAVIRPLLFGLNRVLQTEGLIHVCQFQSPLFLMQISDLRLDSQRNKDSKPADWVLKEFQHNLLPPPPHIWQEAVMSVNTRGLKEDGPKAKSLGYRFPHPKMLVDDKKQLWALAWLLTRSPWMAKILSGDVPLAPTNAVWRDHLFHVAEVSFEIDKDAKAHSISIVKEGRGRRGRVAAAAETIFQTLALLNSSPERVYWKNDLVWNGPDCLLTPAVRQMVSWELCKVSFRFELLMLDQEMMPALWGDSETRAERDSMLRAVFPNDSYFVDAGSKDYELDGAQLTHADLGVAGARWQGRVDYVEALRHLLSGWPGASHLIDLKDLCDPAKFKEEAQKDNGKVARLLKVERAVFAVYCQVFFDTFTRSPTTPRLYPRKL
jgi:hypothetical protein